MYVSAINFCATKILTNFKRKLRADSPKSNQYLSMKVNLILIFRNIEKKKIFSISIFFFRFIDGQRQFFKEKPS